MLSFLDLPEDVWKYVALNLDTPDLLKFLSSHPRFHHGLGQSPAFWNFLLKRHASEEDAREEYMVQAYRRHIPAVKWQRISERSTHISAREGHLSCTFSDGAEDRICITGGFTNDHTVYVLPVKSRMSQASRWLHLAPEGPTDFVYGASLTPIDSTRAIRFGGFQSGGYSSECNIVKLLTLAKLKDEGNGGIETFKCQWQSINARNSSSFAQPRAYHTATLLNKRYLLVLGGMTEEGSILDEAILDTSTMTWLDQSRIMDGMGLGDSRPSCRHGHSAILDENRGRIVIFGGGSGTDLLRSGEDNAEVWELRMGKKWESDLEASFPWTWLKIRSSDPNNEDMDAQREALSAATNEHDSLNDDTALLPLTPTEMLCLGRCHEGLKISQDTALFLLGSGSPSTNGVLAYDLSKDLFLRPHVLGSLPQPRFTFACSLMQKGYILIHGGFCSQDASALGDAYVLDLAPLVSNREFRALPIDINARSHVAVTDEDARQGRLGGERLLHRLFNTLGNATDDERPALAQEMMGQLIANGQYGGQAFMIMRMIANGSGLVQFGGFENSESAESNSDEEDDPDYDEESHSDEEMMGGM